MNDRQTAFGLLFRLLTTLLSFGAILSLILLAGYTLLQQIENHETLRYFHEAHDKLPPSRLATKWTDRQPIGRALYEASRFDLDLAITRAWQNYAKAMHVREEAHLLDHFTDIALKRARHALGASKEMGANMVVTGMTIDPIILHLDSSVFQFRTDDAIIARFSIKDDRLEYYELQKECLIQGLLRNSRGWQIGHNERECSSPLPLARTRPASWDFPPLKGVNYYPQATPWSEFWPNYDPDITREDFARIKEMGGNSIRIFLPYGAFLFDDEAEDNIANLDDFLKEAARAELYVIPTLFDFRGEYLPWNWSDDRIYLENVLEVIADAHALSGHIAYVDLKNELDLDARFQSEALLAAWAHTMIGLARHIAPELNYSIGWSSARHAPQLADYLDIISYHDYEGAAGLADRYMEVREGAAGRPVIISEIGATSFDYVRALPSSPEKQAEKLARRLEVFDESEGVLVWTLYDFSELDEKAIGGTFWNKGIQKNFGLIGQDGVIKPAGKIFSQWEFRNDP